MGISRELKLAALSDPLQVEFAGELVIEREVVDMEVQVNGGRIRRARALEDEVGASFDSEAIGMDLADACEVEIVACQVETEGAAGRIVSGASGDDGIIVEEMDAVKGDFSLSNAEGGIELPDGLTIGGAAGEMDLSFPMRSGEGSATLHEKIGDPRDRIVVSGESLEAREVCLVEVGAEGEYTVAGEVAVL